MHLSVFIIPVVVRLRKHLADIWRQMCLKSILQGQHSKLITDIPDVDIALSMGCNVGCPFIGRSFDDNWGLDDPTGKSDDDFKIVT